MKVENEKIIRKKLFTKSQTNNIISKKYNLLSKYDKIYESEGLFMRETKDVVLNDTKNKIKVDDIVLECWYNICKYYNKEKSIIDEILGEI